MMPPLQPRFVRGRTLARRVGLLACLCVAYAASAQASEPLPWPPVVVADLIPRMAGDENYSDKYTFEFYFDNGYSAYFGLTITNLGPGQLHGKATARLTEPDGTEHSTSRTLSKGDWTSAGDALDVHMGDLRLRGKPEELTLEARGKEFSFTLISVPDVAPVGPPQGTITLQRKDEGSFHTVYVCPRSRVEGSAVFKGQEMALRGFGYGIRTDSTIAPFEMATQWLSFRSVQPDWTVFVKSFTTPEADGARDIAWVVVGGPDGQRFRAERVVVSPSEMTRDSHPNGYEIPGRVFLHARDGDDELWLLFTTDRLRYREEPLKSLSALARMVVSTLMQPVNIEYYASFVARLRVGGTSYAFDGTGNYELNFVKR